MGLETSYDYQDNVGFVYLLYFQIYFTSAHVNGILEEILTLHSRMINVDVSVVLSKLMKFLLII